MHELPLDRRLGQVFRNDRGLESSVLFGVLERLEDRFGREPVAQRIPARGLFSVCARRAGALERVSAVCLDLLERGHARCGPVSIGSEATRVCPPSVRDVPEYPIATTAAP